MRTTRYLAILALCLLPLIVSAGEPEFSPVFVVGKDTYASIRIPAVVVSAKGTVLAFAEGRHKYADQAANHLVLKRSIDGGRTWEPLQIIARDGDNCLNNPCAVVVDGRVILMCQSYPLSLTERSGKIQPGIEGPNIVRNYVLTSDDDGRTWTKPTDITATTKRAVAVTTASGPGLGIQLQYGPHAGRLIFPFNERRGKLFDVYALYSDDRGRTWQIGEPPPGCIQPDGKGGQVGVANEVQMVELSDGSVRLNARRSGGQPLRKTAVSRDGGRTWSKIEEVAQLRDPACMASILRYTPPKGEKGGLLFSGPDSDARANGTVHLSRDDGETWPVSKVLWPGYFAYSVLTELPDGTIGCLFEDGKDKRVTRLVFARFTLDWLTDGR
jgi:sialidase-1